MSDVDKKFKRDTDLALKLTKKLMEKLNLKEIGIDDVSLFSAILTVLATDEYNKVSAS